MNIVAALLIFTVIVVVNEFGHFLLAKKNGVEVTEFSVGMGPRIITFCKTDKGMTCKLFCSQKLFEEREDWAHITKYFMEAVSDRRLLCYGRRGYGG